MEQLHNTPRDDEDKDEEYVAFPGGIPKKWLGPAMTLLCGVAVVYVPWAVWQTIRIGIAAGTPGVHIARDVFQHLVFFAAGMSFLIVVCAKILERVIMYYLQAKKRIDDAERRTEQERQLRLQLEQQRQTERQRAEAAEQRAEQERQRAEAAEQRAEQERQRAEAAEQRAEAAENKKPHA